MGKLKSYLEYRQNKKIAKKELAKIGCIVLPIITSLAENSTDIAKFIQNLVQSAKDMDGEILVQTVLNTIATTLSTSETRLIEIGTYIASLSKEDLQKILASAIVDTLSEEDSDEIKIKIED